MFNKDPQLEDEANGCLGSRRIAEESRGGPGCAVLMVQFPSDTCFVNVLLFSSVACCFDRIFSLSVEQRRGFVGGADAG